MTTPSDATPADRTVAGTADGPPGSDDDSLVLDDLRITIPTGDALVIPADGITLSVRRGEILGIVGETGSGKTVTCRAMLGLLPTRSSRHQGRVSYPRLGQDDVLALPPARMRQLWGSYISMIPQNPMTSLNPIRRIGSQVEEAVSGHAKLSKPQRRERAVELMTRVGIPAAARRLRDHPHNFSGGMLQRTLIAIALAGEPEVLVADEPTTALDVIIQDQILALLLDLQRDTGMSLVLVSHDLSVIAQVCDRVAVMYAGQVVELGPAEEIIASPRHPYTAALLASLPGAVPRDQPLATIPGAPPQLIDQPVTCRFATRCGYAEPRCTTEPNLLVDVKGQGARSVRCIRNEELQGRLAEELHLHST